MPHKRAKRSIRLAETAKKFVRGSNLAPSSSHYDDAPRSAMRILNSLSVQEKFRQGPKRSSEDTGERKPKGKGPKPQTGSTTSGTGKGRDKPSTSTSVAEAVEESGKGKAKAKTTEEIPKILPHESLREYNRRIEALLRPSVTQAIKSANQRKSEQIKAIEREKIEKKRKAKAQAQGISTGSQSPEPTSSSAIKDDKTKGTKRKRVHDVNDGEITFKEAPGPRRLNDVAQAPPSLPSLRHAGKDGKSDSVWTAKGKGKSGLSAAQERILGEERDRVIKRYREMKADKEAERAAEKEKEAAGGKKRKVRVGDDQ